MQKADYPALSRFDVCKRHSEPLLGSILSALDRKATKKFAVIWDFTKKMTTLIMPIRQKVP